MYSSRTTKVKNIREKITNTLNMTSEIEKETYLVLYRNQDHFVCVALARIFVFVYWKEICAERLNYWLKYTYVIFFPILFQV
jgi:hypothetical protein